MPMPLNPNPKGLKVGDRLADNDVRNQGRIITISRLLHNRKGEWCIEYKTEKRRNRVSFDRVFVDMAPHSQGYSLLREELA